MYTKQVRWKIEPSFDDCVVNCYGNGVRYVIVGWLHETFVYESILIFKGSNKLSLFAVYQMASSKP